MLTHPQLLSDVLSDGSLDLRELPDPVFPLPHPERVKHTKERGEPSHILMEDGFGISLTMQRRTFIATSVRFVAGSGDCHRSTRQRFAP